MTSASCCRTSRATSGYRASAIPTSAQVVGPVNDASAMCGATSVQSVSPQPVRRHAGQDRSGYVAESGSPTGAGMATFGKGLLKDQ